MTKNIDEFDLELSSLPMELDAIPEIVGIYQVYCTCEVGICSPICSTLIPPRACDRGGIPVTVHNPDLKLGLRNCQFTDSNTLGAGSRVLNKRRAFITLLSMPALGHMVYWLGGC